MGELLQNMESYKIEADDVVITLHSVELDGEPTGVAGLVWELSPKSDGREAHKDRSLFTNTGQEVGFLRTRYERGPPKHDVRPSYCE